MARLPHIYKVLPIKVNEETNKAPLKIYKKIFLFFQWLTQIIHTLLYNIQLHDIVHKTILANLLH